MTAFQWNVTPTFLRNWETSKRIVINRGGTRSGKTYSLLMMIANWLFTGYIREGQHIAEGVCSVVRKNKTTVKATVLRDFDEILKDYGLYNLVKINKTDRTYRVNNRIVEFMGADDEQKLRGGKRAILFCNEANELLADKEFFQLVVRTSGPIFIDFNPSDPYIWIKTELEDKRAKQKGDVETIVSTYKDNPTLLDTQISEIEYLQVTDKQLWQVYGLGKYGKVEGLIYPDYQIIENIPDGVRKAAAGLDFGYTNSATALIDCFFIEPNNLYIEQKIYSHGLTDSLLIKSMENINYPKQKLIVADSAQAGSIAELQGKRYNVKPVRKFKNSVVFGINLLQQMNWHVTANSQDVIREMRTYKYKQTATGDWLNEPNEGNDHALDAIRYYALHNLASSQPRGRRRTA